MSRVEAAGRRRGRPSCTGAGHVGADPTPGSGTWIRRTEVLTPVHPDGAWFAVPVVDRDAVLDAFDLRDPVPATMGSRVPARSLGDAEQAQKEGAVAAEVASMDLSGMGFGRVMAVRLLIEGGGDFCCRAGAVATKGGHHRVVCDPWGPVVTGERATS
jgi:hypothetical protein